MESILKLNNEGVKMLDKGDNRGAAQKFRKAFDELKSSFSPQSTSQSMSQQQPKENGQKKGEKAPVLPPTTRTDVDQQTSSSSPTRTSSPMEDSKPKSNREKRKRTCHDDEQHNRKRQKKSPSRTSAKATWTSASTKADGGVLGRPLWLASSTQLSATPKSVNACGSSILYNYAYSLQRLRSDLAFDMNENAIEAKGLLWKEATRVYEKARRLASRGNNPVVEWISSHNMQFLLVDQGLSPEIPPAFHSKYQELECIKVDVLRSMVGAGSPPDHSVLVVLSMLGLEKNERHNRPAAVA